MTAANKLENVRRRVNRARANAPCVTAAERHVQQMADSLVSSRPYRMFDEEKDACALSLYAVLESLWKLRAREKRA